MAVHQTLLAKWISEANPDAIAHHPWMVQARLWVQLRSEDKHIDTTGSIENIRGNDYASEWGGMLDILRAGGMVIENDTL